MLDFTRDPQAVEHIARLLEPVGWDEFRSAYWDKQPLHLKGEPGQFDTLGCVGRVRQLIESGSPWQYRRLPEIYLDGSFVEHDNVVRDYIDMDNRPARTPLLGRIRSLMAAGATVNCFGQETSFPALALLKSQFAAALLAEVETSFFYSRKNHQGLAPHYDCVEIFVLQISGTKRWHVSTQRVAHPLVGTGSATPYHSSAPHAHIDLEAGDLLYLPRGVFHQAIATSEESLHTSIAVKLPNYADMLKVLCAVALEEPQMREYLPLEGEDLLACAQVMLSKAADVVSGGAYTSALRQMLAVRSRLEISGKRAAGP